MNGLRGGYIEYRLSSVNSLRPGLKQSLFLALF